MRFSQIKQALKEAEIIDEVRMSPSALQKFANSPEAEGMLVGIEFEMGVPNAAVDDDSGEGEYDYDQNQSAYDIDDIINFFRNGDNSTLSRQGADRLRNEMWDQYLDWAMGAISDNLDQDELDSRVRDRLSEDVDWEDYLDDAREELGDEVSDSAVEEKAKEIAEEYLNGMMADTDSREYQRAYDDIRQEMEDEMRNDGDYDQQAWLEDIGVEDMMSAEREWGLDWPHWNYYGGGGDVSVDEVADDFGRAMGLEEVNTSTNYHGARRDGKRWIIEPDSSIDADEGDGGLEFVSPPMPLKDGLEMIQKFYKWAKDYGCYTNKSTGLHMNISVPDMTVEKLDYVKLALFLGDEYVLKQFGREYNSYAKSAMSKIKDRIRPEDVPTVLAQVKQNLNSLASKAIHSGITDKYTSINTKGNYVEFRGPGGDYLDQNPFDLINTALRLSMSLRIATNPEAYKQEYAKKLYKLVEQEKNPDESVKLFSQYALGELPKEDLVARLKFAKKERELEKTKKDSLERMSQNPDVQLKINELPGFAWRSMLRDMSSHTDQELQSTANNIINGEYDDELNQDQRSFVVAVIQNELVWRKQQGEQTAFWVMNKDGSGGKQLVYANNENQAIIKGGKQMGMTREQSIVKLRAEEKRDPLDLDSISDEEFRKQHRSLPTFTLEKFVAEIRDKERSSLEKALDSVKRRALSSDVTPENYEFLQAVIERELKRRDEEGDQGPVDNNETRWKVKLTIPTSNPNYDPVYVNADTPRQAKLKAQELFRREQNLTVDIDNLEAIATTPDAGEQSTEWPRPWNQWVANIQGQGYSNLVNVRMTMADTENLSSSLNNQQRAALVNLIDAELRRRTMAAVAASDRAQAQQAELVNRDDPVTSNDPEAQPQQGVDPEHREWEIYNPSTGEVIARVSQGDAVYAVRKAREHEQDLGLSVGNLDIRAINQTNESINTIRRLAGLQ